MSAPTVKRVLTRKEELRAVDELVERGYAIDAGEGEVWLRSAGQQWLLLAVWLALGAPGFEPEWYSANYGACADVMGREG